MQRCLVISQALDGRPLRRSSTALPPAGSIRRQHPAVRRDRCGLPLLPRAEAVAAARGAAAFLEAQACAPVAEHAQQFYQLSETNNYNDLKKLVTSDCKWRQRGLLQGNKTHAGVEAVHQACLVLHAAYQDLTYTIHTSAEEGGRCVVYWTASGVNRVPLFGRPATFHRSTFSGVSIIYSAPDGRIREVVEYRQPTHEEMAVFLRKDSKNSVVQRLQQRGHAVPSAPACSLPAAKEVAPEWRLRAVQAATEWVENWTPGPDLASLVREDMEEYNIYSWPDFEQDVVGRDALEERCRRSPQEAIVIRDIMADSGTNLVAIHWNDFELLAASQQKSAAAAASSSSPTPTPSRTAGGEGLPERSLPREQPTLHPEHGSVERVEGGHLRVHLSTATRLSRWRKRGRNKAIRMACAAQLWTPGDPLARSTSSGSSIDEPGTAGLSMDAALKLHKYRGVTLFGIDADCKLAWQVTFRELKASEEVEYLASPSPR